MNSRSWMGFPDFYRAVELTSKGSILVTQQFPHNVLESDSAIVVKPIVVGICRSDVKEAQGNRTVRHDFGHEIVGTVEWASANIPLSHGDFVCLDPHIHLSRTSGFGEFVIAEGNLPNICNAFLKSVQGISIEKLVFSEPTACAQHCVSNLLRYLQASRLDDCRIGIIGAGNAGVLIGLLVKYLGGSVTLFNRSNEKLAFLQERQIFSKKELSPLSAGNNEQFDVVIPTTSFLHSLILRFAIQAIRSKGLLLLYGGTKKGDCLPDTSLDIDWIRRKEILSSVTCMQKSFQVGGTYGARSQDFLSVMNLFGSASAHFPVERLILREVSLEEVPATLQLLETTTSQGKILVRFN